MPEARSLRVDLKPSLLLAGALALAHALALTAAAVSLHGWALVLVAAGVILSGTASIAKALHATRATVQAIELRDDGRAAWLDRAGRWHETRMGEPHFVSSWLVVVTLGADARGSRRVVLPRDGSDRESFRRLLVWLRWRGHESAASLRGTETHARKGAGDALGND